jgi:RHS repeat-associated protein
LVNANLIDTLTAPSGLLQDKNWEARGLLSSITTRDSASTVLKNFTYGLNSLGQRTTVTREDSAVLTLGYDARRQVTSGQKTSAGSTFPAYDFSYAFDEIGNRKSAGTAAQPAATTYGRNALNQYTAITQAALTLNPTYDLNGSTLSDGRNVSTWDQRNQRRSVTQTSTSEQLFCKFDAVGRRTEEQELSSSGSELRKTRFLYDGWNCVAEFAVTPVTAALIRKKTHTWGLDLSQTPQGAGGVGGLLATVDETTAKAVYTFAYDGNGNVAALYSNSFVPAASYEYDPFGKTISASGPYATENKYRFSTKPQDRIGGLYYYGYRYYGPVTGRWPSRDPVGEKGGSNHDRMIEKNPINKIDYLGKFGAAAFPNSNGCWVNAWTG